MGSVIIVGRTFPGGGCGPRPTGPIIIITPRQPTLPLPTRPRG